MIALWTYRLEVFRKRAGLTQREAARRSGVGEKTLSSFETRQRIESIKVVQLAKILRVYGVTLAQFFAEDDNPKREVIDRRNDAPFTR